MKRKHGDTREDGFRFVGYRRRKGQIKEEWASPKSFEKIAARRARWNASHKELKKELDKAYVARDRRKAGDKSRRWRKAHPEAVAAALRDWKQRNPANVYSHAATRRARERGAKPVSFSRPIAGAIKACAVRVTKCVGIRFVVDHIIPIAKGGLHHQRNLQVIPHRLNLKKSATLDPKIYPEQQMLLAA